MTINAGQKPLAMKWIRLLTLWFLMGAAYFAIEIVWRIPKGEFPHWSMWIVGGLCGVAVGGINQRSRYYNLPVLLQSLIGTLITLFIEFCSGLILNVWMGLDIWDYADMSLNVMGQICLPFALAWLMLMPFAIWLEDTLRWGFGWDGKAYSLLSIYKEFFTFR